MTAGGADRQYGPTVSCLRPGSMAHRCDQIQVGDRLLKVNGIDVRPLKHDQVYTLLKNAGDKVKLEFEYELLDECSLPALTLLLLTPPTRPPPPRCLM